MFREELLDLSEQILTAEQTEAFSLVDQALGLILKHAETLDHHTPDDLEALGTIMDYRHIADNVFNKIEQKDTLEEFTDNVFIGAWVRWLLVGGVDLRFQQSDISNWHPFASRFQSLILRARS